MASKDGTGLQTAVAAPFTATPVQQVLPMASVRPLTGTPSSSRGASPALAPSPSHSMASPVPSPLAKPPPCESPVKSLASSSMTMTGPPNVTVTCSSVIPHPQWNVQMAAQKQLASMQLKSLAASQAPPPSPSPPIKPPAAATPPPNVVAPTVMVSPAMAIRPQGLPQGINKPLASLVATPVSSTQTAKVLPAVMNQAGFSVSTGSLPPSVSMALSKPLTTFAAGSMSSAISLPGLPAASLSQSHTSTTNLLPTSSSQLTGATPPPPNVTITASSLSVQPSSLTFQQAASMSLPQPTISLPLSSSPAHTTSITLPNTNLTIHTAVRPTAVSVSSQPHNASVKPLGSLPQPANVSVHSFSSASPNVTVRPLNPVSVTSSPAPNVTVRPLRMVAVPSLPQTGTSATTTQPGMVANSSTLPSLQPKTTTNLALVAPQSNMVLRAPIGTKPDGTPPTIQTIQLTPEDQRSLAQIQKHVKVLMAYPDRNEDQQRRLRHLGEVQQRILTRGRVQAIIAQQAAAAAAANASSTGIQPPVTATTISVQRMPIVSIPSSVTNIPPSTAGLLSPKSTIQSAVSVPTPSPATQSSPLQPAVRPTNVHQVRPNTIQLPTSTAQPQPQPQPAVRFQRGQPITLPVSSSQFTSSTPTSSATVSQPLVAPPNTTVTQGEGHWGANLTHWGLVTSFGKWQHRSGSTLAQVMACCLTAASHYLNQCWLIISKV